MTTDIRIVENKGRVGAAAFRTLLVLALMVALPLDAAAQRKSGRAGAAFLKVSVGARATALGSAASSIIGDANQAFWNPAGTALMADQTLDVSLSYNDWIGGITHTAAAIGYNLDNVGTLTLGVQAFGVTDIPANRENGYTDPILQGLVTDDGTSDTYNFQDIAVSLSLGRYLVDNFLLGATVRVVSETIDGHSAQAIGFDFGSIYKVGIAGWQISSRVSNLGSSLSYFNQSNPMPLVFTIGTSFYLINEEEARLMIAVDATKPQEAQQLLYGGAEVSLYDLLFLRAGYKFNYSGTDDGGSARRDAVNTTIEGLSLGAGLQYEVSGYDVAIDYAYTQMDLLDAVHRFTLRFGL
jgi:hypothetical protein